MKTTGRFAIAIATIFVRSTLLIAFTPKRTEGTVATAVQVVNSSLPVDVENSAVRIPFQTNVTIANGVAGSFGVPYGQRLVIEYVSATCNNSQPQFATLAVTTALFDGTTTPHFFPPIFTGFEETYQYVVAQPTHIYASAGSVVYLTAPSIGIVCSASVSGYLVNH